MKRRYKLLLILASTLILTFFINKGIKNDKKSIVVMGDSLAYGETSYNTIGTSFSDYLSDYLEKKDDLKNYNNDFAIDNLYIHDLTHYLNENKQTENGKTIKQIIDKCDILLIAIGEDEFVNYSIKNKVNESVLEEYLSNYESLLKSLRSFYNKDIVIISLYDNLYLSKNDVFEVNKSLETLAVNYKAKYLDIISITSSEDVFFNNHSYYLNYLGHKNISEELKILLKI